MQLWLQSRIQIANINLELARVSEGAPLAKRQDSSIQALRETAEYISKNGEPQQLASAQNALGTALLDKADMCPLAERNSILSEAGDLFQQALQVFNKSDHPREFAMVSNNLGIALHKQSQWPFEREAFAKKALLDQATVHYKDASEIYERLGPPGQGALVAMNIAFLARDRDGPAAKSRNASLEQTAHALEAVLASKGNAGNTQAKMNLAGCLVELAELEPGNRQQRVEKAVALLNSIQGLRSSNPRRWARIESLIGQAHLAASFSESPEKWKQLRESTRAIRDALSVFTPATSPMDWAGNQARLGMGMALLSGDPELTSEEREKMLVNGLVGIIEATSLLTSNPTFRKEGEDLIKALGKSNQTNDAPH